MPRSRLLARLLAIVLLGLLAAGILYSLRSPFDITETQVRRMVSSGELIGLPLAEAGERLQHRVPGTADGTVVLDFRNVKGWKAGPLTLDVREGRVISATWGEPRDDEE
ncbi:MAG: hypothetical protein WD749_06345 [Phycisphaerales bacterium]